MKRLNQTESPIFVIVCVCSLFPKAIFCFTFILLCLISKFFPILHTICWNTIADTDLDKMGIKENGFIISQQNIYCEYSLEASRIPARHDLNSVDRAVRLNGSLGNTRFSYIRKTCLYNFDPLKPHFYIVKLGFTGVYIIFLISAQNIDCGYSLEPPHRGGSNEYLQSMFWAEIWKISEVFIWKFSVFGGEIFYIFV